MDMMKLVNKLGWLPPRWVAVLERQIKKIPAVQSQIDKEMDRFLDGLADSLKPYQQEFETFARLPAQGRDRAAILSDLQAIQAQETTRWQDGYASGAVYHGDEEHIAFLNQVYALHSQSNPLHADLWPSAAKFEAEIVSMTAHLMTAHLMGAHLMGAHLMGPHLMGAQNAKTQDAIVGTVSSGGTESILLAMKSYRDWAQARKGITQPEMIAPVTAHAAFEKAAHYFNIKLVRIPVTTDFRADVAAASRAINRNTIVLVGSAPSFPHGVIDPMPALSALAQAHGIGCHTDACLGGFVLPWAEKLGYPVTPFDFRLPGVTSISVDTHKYGYAAKGASVILYRGQELRHYQYYTTTDWPGGLYFSPTFAGSRPGALSATCWAALVTMGEDGYLDATRRILETAAHIRQGIEKIPELRLLGDPLWVLAFTSDTLDIYRVLDGMTKRGWSLNGLHKPACIHLCVTLRHTQPGVADRFLTDLHAAITQVKNHPAPTDGMAPVYGMAATLPVRGLVGDMLKQYMDLLYKV